MRKVAYLTFNDAPSGIYTSQVIDVVSFLRSELKADIRLISFISIRSFLLNRKKIKSALPDSIVLPMFPGIQNWKINVLLLLPVIVMLRPSTIIARSVLAAQLAMRARFGARLVYDGRGAIAAEWNEYPVVVSKRLKDRIFWLEREVVNASDFRIAVSWQLVEHWKREFGYQADDHVVIPCTLSKVFEHVRITEEAVRTAREKLGFADDDIVFVYSGSIAGWQGFDLLAGFMIPRLKESEKVKLLFLSAETQQIRTLQEEFPGQVVVRQLKPDQVPQYLLAGDYGLLIREQSVTNQVASPVKFAEYLVCGLPVIIGEGLGDFTDFVRINRCGWQVNMATVLIRCSYEKRHEIGQLGFSKFSKFNFRREFTRVLLT